MIDPLDVLALYETRRKARGPEIARMLDVRTTYDGDLAVPLPELDETERPAVANLLMQGIDQLGMRASGVDPDISFRPYSNSRPAQAHADDQRRAILSYWEMNKLAKKEARRCRYLVGYGTGPMAIKPVAYMGKRCMPYWHTIDPLCLFPAPMDDKDCIEPRDAIIHRKVTLGWLRQFYPSAAARIYKGPLPGRSSSLWTPAGQARGEHPNDMKFSLLEYNDEYETVLVLCGQPPSGTKRDPSEGQTKVELLERAENRAGIPFVVSPGRVSLHALMGHFDQIIGMFLAQAKMTAYENIAVRKGIFPELWVMTHPNSPTTARIIRIADGKQGIIGEIENGVIETIKTEPGQMAQQAIDRYERAQRVQASIPSDWGGESGPAIRTAKRGQQVMASATDPTLAEIQTVLQESKEAEVVRAIAIMKGYHGSKMVSFYQPRDGSTVGETYRPSALFDTDYCEVKYSMPGVDAASIPIELGQRTQTGEISQDTARRLDPIVEDPEHEADMVEVEGLRMALLHQMEQQALDPHMVAYAIQAKMKKVPIEEAVIAAHERIQQEQAGAQEDGAGPEAGMPGMSAMAAGGMGGAQQGQAGPPPLAQLLGQLRQPTQQSKAEQAIGA